MTIKQEGPPPKKHTGETNHAVEQVEGTELLPSLEKEFNRQFEVLTSEPYLQAIRMSEESYLAMLEELRQKLPEVAAQLVDEDLGEDRIPLVIVVRDAVFGRAAPYHQNEPRDIPARGTFDQGWFRNQLNYRESLKQKGPSVEIPHGLAYLMIGVRKIPLHYDYKTKKIHFSPQNEERVREKRREFLTFEECRAFLLEQGKTGDDKYLAMGSCTKNDPNSAPKVYYNFSFGDRLIKYTWNVYEVNNYALVCENRIGLEADNSNQLVRFTVITDKVEVQNRRPGERFVLVSKDKRTLYIEDGAEVSSQDVLGIITKNFPELNPEKFKFTPSDYVHPLKSMSVSVKYCDS